MIDSSTTTTLAWIWRSAMVGLVQGTSAITRVGSQITIKRFDVSLTIGPNVPNAQITGSMCRFVFYHNKVAAAALPTTLVVFDSDAYNSMRNLPQKKRVILKKDFSVPFMVYQASGATAQTAGPVYRMTFSIPVNKKVTYQTNLGTMSDLGNDDYGIGFSSDDANCCQVHCVTKMVFTDD